MKQIIVIALFVLGLSMVQCSHINFDCVITECSQELDECLKSEDCKKQYDLMNQCYTKSSSDCFSKFWMSDDRLITEECMQSCLNESSIQTLEGSNVISCQFEQCQIVNWDYFGIFKGQQNRAYFVAWFMFFAILSTLALIVKALTKN